MLVTRSEPAHVPRDLPVVKSPLFITSGEAGHFSHAVHLSWKRLSFSRFLHLRQTEQWLVPAHLLPVPLQRNEPRSHLQTQPHLPFSHSSLVACIAG